MQIKKWIDFLPHVFLVYSSHWYELNSFYFFIYFYEFIYLTYHHRPSNRHGLMARRYQYQSHQRDYLWTDQQPCCCLRWQKFMPNPILSSYQFLHKRNQRIRKKDLPSWMGKISQVKALLSKNGIEEKDIQSVNISINPNYNYDNGKSTIDGFVASHGLSIKIRNLENVDDFLPESVR